MEGASIDIEPWDYRYYMEKVRQDRYALSQDEIKPYFELNNMIDAMFHMAGELYGLEFREITGTVPVWHPDVRAWRVTRASDGSDVGVFYGDNFARSGKRSGAWMNPLITGGPRPHDDSFEPHIGVVAANFTPPEGASQPQLTHDEVTTVFHEFGHLLHHTMSRVPVKSRAGLAAPWDFVELPSQIMENWTWEKQALDLFARHVETGDTIPQELFDRLHRSRTFNGAIAQMRQLAFGTMDLALHREYEPASDEDPLEFTKRVVEPFEVRPEFASGARLTRFTHVFAGGYAAGYYSYKWSEVLDADAFSRFQAEGIFNPDTGRHFADAVLAKGDGDDSAQLFRDFMGRDPDLGALIRRNLGAESEGVTPA